MKTRIVMFFVAIGCLVGCNDTDDAMQDETSINGTWNLKNVSGGFSPINIEYNIGDVIWTFNEATTTLMVENNILTTGPEDLYAGLDTGSYSYNIEIEDGFEFLFIEGVQRGTLSFSPNTMEIDDRVSDGFISEFER